MHPMAVYCALKGMVPLRPRFATEGQHEFRIWCDPAMRHPHPRVLRWTETEAPRGKNHWDITLGAARDRYDEIAWDVIPDRVMDQLSQALVDEYASL